MEKLSLFASPACADSGIISMKSSHDVKITADRLKNDLIAKGIRVFIKNALYEVLFYFSREEYGLNITQSPCYVFFNTQTRPIYGINL